MGSAVASATMRPSELHHDGQGGVAQEVLDVLVARVTRDGEEPEPVVLIRHLLVQPVELRCVVAHDWSYHRHGAVSEEDVGRRRKC